MLTERQALFKQAALEAKKAGNMEEAKGSYLHDVLKIGFGPILIKFIFVHHHIYRAWLKGGS